MKSHNQKILCIVLGFILASCLAWTYTYDIATPVGTDAPSVLDDRDRETKAATQERLNVDHYFALTGTQVSDAAVGQHRQIEFYAPISKPSSAANKGWLYSKDVSAKVELHWEDEDGDEVQFTDGGGFNMALLTSGTITTPTLTSPVINTSVSGTAVLDEDDMSTDSSTQIATQQSIKAYVDAQIAAMGSLLGTWTSRTTDTSYLAATDGFACAYSLTGTAHLQGYTDSQNPPVTLRLTDNPAGISGGARCLTMPVKKGDYWKVNNADTLYWLPLGL